MDLRKEESEKIQHLLTYIGQTVPDNLAPNLRAAVKEYNGDGTFTLEYESYQRKVAFWVLENMIYGA
jgi:hypothetical protein